MEYLIFALAICLGLTLLVFAGEWLTLGASSLARHIGVGPIVIGMTVVAFGTSTPEAFTSILAAVQKKPDIAIANVLGSNIFNIAFILGLSALFNPLHVESYLSKRVIPFVVGSSLLVWVLASDGVLAQLDGLILLLAFFLFLSYSLRSASGPEEKVDDQKEGLGRYVFALLLSLILLAGGAKLLVYGSVGVAEKLGVNELLIGLTIVAIGTSLPELATSVIASIKKQDNIAIGNVAGSNIFNVLFILGLAACIHPLRVSASSINRDMPVMIGLSLLLIPILKSGRIITRVEGVVLVLLYVGYLGMLIV